jgi:pantoate--beta-alanine ligase
MIIFRKAEDIKKFLEKKKNESKTLAFVPTMGALHAGHISLINEAKTTDALTISSIFVNPTQFNNQLDFVKYPKTIEQDIYLLVRSGCDVLFLPSTEEMYPNGQTSPIHYDLGYLETILEGKYRPGHFQGVCQIVHRLLAITQPDILFLGQKDYQQCMVINKLIELTGIQTVLKICSTQREPSGLAMSSRNMRLNETEKQQAAKIYETLQFIKKEIRVGDLTNLKASATEYLSGAGFKVDYVEIANSINLEPVETWDGKITLVALIAAYLNDVRLIDNLLITN